MGRKKRINKWLNIIMAITAGIFLLVSVITYIFLKTHPDIYAMMSAPWYLSVCLYAIIALIVIAICLIIKLIIKKRK